MAKKRKELRIKTAEEDFSSASLPATRKAQFKDFYTHEFGSIMRMGLWFFIAAIPYFALYVIQSSFLETLYAGKIVEEASVASFAFYANLAFDGMRILCYGVFSIALAGSLRVIRNLTYGEGVLFKEDYLLGIKMYWKLCLLNAVLFGIMKLLINASQQFVNLAPDQTTVQLLSGIAVGFSYLFVVPMMMFAISLGMTYSLKKGETVALSIRFSLSNFLVCFLFSAVLFGLKMLAYLPFMNVLIVLAIGIVLSFFGVVPFLLFWHLYVTSRFDKYINEASFPEIYRKGLSE